LDEWRLQLSNEEILFFLLLEMDCETTNGSLSRLGGKQKRERGSYMYRGFPELSGSVIRKDGVILEILRVEFLRQQPVHECFVHLPCAVFVVNPLPLVFRRVFTQLVADDRKVWPMMLRPVAFRIQVQFVYFLTEKK
jgi:hypothetical protein